MKKEYYFLMALVSIALVSCNSNRSAGSLAVIDTSRSFPEKTLVLQDFAQVEYVALETTDDFVTADIAPVFINNNIIVMTMRQTGEVMIYDRKTGRAINKFSRQGRSGQEYLSIGGLTVDYESGEIFIQSRNRILVYDMQGGFKRVLELPGYSISSMFNYNEGNLICYDASRINSQPCFLIDKTDGRITHEFVMPIGDSIASEIRVHSPRTGATSFIYRLTAQCVRTYNGYVIGKPAIDTLYRIDPLADRIAPALVHASHILKMEPADFNLLSVLNETEEMTFLETMKINRDFEVASGRPFTNERLVYFKESGESFVQKITNADYDGWESYVGSNQGDYPAGTACFVLSAFQLAADRESGKLKGDLAAVASNIAQDDNPVMAIVHFR